MQKGQQVPRPLCLKNRHGARVAGEDTGREQLGGDVRDVRGWPRCMELAFTLSDTGSRWWILSSDSTVWKADGGGAARLPGETGGGLDRVPTEEVLRRWLVPGCFERKPPSEFAAGCSGLRAESRMVPGLLA